MVWKGAVNAIVSAVREAGPKCCPQLLYGVGIGGTFEKGCSYGKSRHLQDLWVLIPSFLLLKANGKKEGS